MNTIHLVDVLGDPSGAPRLYRGRPVVATFAFAGVPPPRALVCLPGGSWQIRETVEVVVRQDWQCDVYVACAAASVPHPDAEAPVA